MVDGWSRVWAIRVSSLQKCRHGSAVTWCHFLVAFRNFASSQEHLFIPPYHVEIKPKSNKVLKWGLQKLSKSTCLVYAKMPSVTSNRRPLRQVRRRTDLQLRTMHWIWRWCLYPLRTTMIRYSRYSPNSPLMCSFQTQILLVCSVHCVAQKKFTCNANHRYYRHGQGQWHQFSVWCNQRNENNQKANGSWNYSQMHSPSQASNTFPITLSAACWNLYPSSLLLIMLVVVVVCICILISWLCNLFVFCGAMIFDSDFSS